MTVSLSLFTNDWYSFRVSQMEKWIHWSHENTLNKHITSLPLTWVMFFCVDKKGNERLVCSITVISCFQDSCELSKGPCSLPQSRSSFSFSLAEYITYYLLLACLIPRNMFVCVVGGVEGLLIGLSEDQDNRRENVTISDASAALSNLLESNSEKYFAPQTT